MFVFFNTWNSCYQLPDTRGDLLRAGGLSSRSTARRKTRLRMTVGDDGDVSSVTVKNPRCHFFFFLGTAPKKKSNCRSVIATQGQSDTLASACLSIPTTWGTFTLLDRTWFICFASQNATTSMPATDRYGVRLLT